MTLKQIKRKIQKLFFYEQWQLLVCDKNNQVLKRIVPPRDRIWADPFPIEHEGKIFIFLEEQIFKENGILGFIELFPDLSYSHFKPILKKNYHLSWPNVFCIDDEWYMIPETNEAHKIDLYKAECFPYKWGHEITLMENVQAVDTMLYKQDNTYYLCTSIKTENTNFNNSLFVFMSNEFPTNKWKAHPQNPVVQNIEQARMAGRFFTNQDGKLVRPAQNSLIEYGSSIRLQEVQEISPTVYKEAFLLDIKGEKSLHACCTHTYNECGEFIFRDIKMRKFRLW